MLKCLKIVEPYHLMRVLRQFGRQYIIPSASLSSEQRVWGSSATTYRPSYHFYEEVWGVWQSHVLLVEHRSVPSRFRDDCAPDYMDWYARVSHRYVQNPDHRSIGAPPLVQMSSEQSSLTAEKVDHFNIHISLFLVIFFIATYTIFICDYFSALSKSGLFLDQ